MPITEQIYQVLYNKVDAKVAAQRLLSRDIKSE
jgi:glycerol-3-phosphate dehydrogenase